MALERAGQYLSASLKDIPRWQYTIQQKPLLKKLMRSTFYTIISIIDRCMG